MPVDKFGRMTDAKTRDTGDSLTYINNNYIGSDGSTPVTGSIDMKGYTGMSAPGRIIRGSLRATQSRIILSEKVEVNIVVNGKEQVNQSIVKKPGDISSCSIFSDPIELKQGDVINFISRTTNSKITNAYVSILIELDL